jgi:hypothetical protein
MAEHVVTHPAALLRTVIGEVVVQRPSCWNG